MTTSELQQWLNSKGQKLVVDGVVGPGTRAAIMAVFFNPAPQPISEDELAQVAARLGCTVKQVKAIAKVESGGSAFRNGRPKILFERHIFYRLTDGKFPITPFNQPTGGGYNEDSWDKLTRAAAYDPDAAFASASWGRFQVLGSHWHALNYPSSIELAYSTVRSELSHYELLARYIEHFGLKKAAQALSTNPKDNEAFAKGYNGPAFRKFSYDVKLAEAMA